MEKTTSGQRPWFWGGTIPILTRGLTFGRQAPLLYSEGELYTIQGTSRAVALTGPTDFCSPAQDPDGDGRCDNGAVVGATATLAGANIWGGAMRLGFEDSNASGPGAWLAAMVETGFSTGQNGDIFNLRTLSQRPNNRDYLVGLLLYPVALNAVTADGYNVAPSIWSNGGVWNSMYMMPQVRVRPLGINGGPGIIGQVLFCFPGVLNAPLGRPGASAQGCGLSDHCLLGWEADLAIKISWGPHDEMRWSNEFGVMNAGPALGPLLAESVLWTLQSRIAFVF